MLTPGCRAAFNKVFCSCAIEDNSLIDDGKFVYYPLKIKESFLLCGRRKSYFPYQCFVGPDWMMLPLVYFLIIVINVVVLYIISPVGIEPVFIGAVGAICLLISYSVVSCSNPGIIFKNYYTPIDVESSDVEDPIHSHEDDRKPMQIQAGITVSLTGPNTMDCGQCNIKRPLSASHCSYCKVCIDELDHHCPWCGKCIGEKNMNFFWIFIWCLSFQFYYLLGAFVYFLIYRFGNVNAPGGTQFS